MQDSRKLSMLLKRWRDPAFGQMTPLECAAELEAALAQQAQCGRTDEQPSHRYDSGIGGEWERCYGAPGRRALDDALSLRKYYPAQQVQPLTDEMIEAESSESRNAANWDEQKAFERGAKWARDQMAQQAQPECKSPITWTRKDGGTTMTHYCGCPLHAQPEMPTREMIAQTMCDTMAETNPEAGDDTFGIMADAVLALFAPKL